MNVLFNTVSFKTPLGMMRLVGNESAVYALSFDDLTSLKLENTTLSVGSTEPMRMLQAELELYFKGILKVFKTPINLSGTRFQQRAWAALLTIPYGETSSYKTQAIAMGAPQAYRAVGHANGLNPVAIVVPCHRVLNHQGGLGGYSAGIERKQWLLAHEKRYRLAEY